MSKTKTFFFMTLMTVLTVFIGHLFDLYFGGGGAFVKIFFLISLGMNFFSYWFADTVVLKMHGARVVTPEEAPELHAIVDRLVARSKMPKPKVCVVATHMPNAFATGRNPSHAAVAVTTGLMQTLNEDELEGVIAHELAHVRHYDMLLGTVVASLAGLISLLATQARWGMLLGGGRDRENNNPLALVGILLVAFLAPMLAMLIRSLISHQQEFAADAGGAAICGKPLALASALQKIERTATGMAQRHVRNDMGNEGMAHMYIINQFSLGRAARLFSTHPPTDERIERLLAIAQKMGQA